MEGYLDKEQLKEMDRKSLQALAKEMGVSAAGKNEEIIERIAAVKCNVSEDETVADDNKTQTPDNTEDQEETKTPDETEDAENGADEQQRENGVKVKVIRTFHDRMLDQIKEPGESYMVGADRAEELAAAGVAEIVG